MFYLRVHEDASDIIEVIAQCNHLAFKKAKNNFINPSVLHQNITQQQEHEGFYYSIKNKVHYEYGVDGDGDFYLLNKKHPYGKGFPDNVLVYKSCYLCYRI